MVHQLLLVFALVCFVLSGWPPAPPNWNRLVSVGLACLAAAMLW